MLRDIEAQVAQEPAAVAASLAQLESGEPREGQRPASDLEDLLCVPPNSAGRTTAAFLFVPMPSGVASCPGPGVALALATASA
jgi:hypothetical protein